MPGTHRNLNRSSTWHFCNSNYIVGRVISSYNSDSIKESTKESCLILHIGQLSLAKIIIARMVMHYHNYVPSYTKCYTYCINLIGYH